MTQGALHHFVKVQRDRVPKPSLAHAEWARARRYRFMRLLLKFKAQESCIQAFAASEVVEERSASRAAFDLRGHFHGAHPATMHRIWRMESSLRSGSEFKCSC